MKVTERKGCTEEAAKEEGPWSWSEVQDKACKEEGADWGGWPCLYPVWEGGQCFGGGSDGGPLPGPGLWARFI